MLNWHTISLMEPYSYDYLHTDLNTSFSDKENSTPTKFRNTLNKVIDFLSPKQRNDSPMSNSSAFSMGTDTPKVTKRGKYRHRVESVTFGRL